MCDPEFEETREDQGQVAVAEVVRQGAMVMALGFGATCPVESLLPLWVLPGSVWAVGLVNRGRAGDSVRRTVILLRRGKVRGDDYLMDERHIRR